MPAATPQPATAAPAPSAPAPAKPRTSTLAFLVRLALFAWLLRSLILDPFFIPSGSMLPTMAIGDYLFVAKWPYGYSRYSFPWQIPPIAGRILGRLPTRGDIVVFKQPGNERASFVKRAIGLPGDTIEVRGGILILNGAAIPKVSLGDARLLVTPNSPCRTVGGITPRLAPAGASGAACLYPAFRETLPNGRSYTVLDQFDSPLADHFGPVTVPAGTVFMMGDNRDDSEDSRFSIAEGGIGPVPVDHLVGRATGIFWSTDGSASYFKPWTWVTALRWHRLGHAY